MFDRGFRDDRMTRGAYKQHYDEGRLGSAHSVAGRAKYVLSEQSSSPFRQELGRLLPGQQSLADFLTVTTIPLAAGTRKLISLGHRTYA